MPIQVIEKKCPQNHKCPAVSFCPVDALEQNGVNAPIVRIDKCIDCGKCVSICPTGALSLIKKTKNE